MTDITRRNFLDRTKNSTLALAAGLGALDSMAGYTTHRAAVEKR